MPWCWFDAAAASDAVAGCCRDVSLTSYITVLMADIGP